MSAEWADQPPVDNHGVPGRTLAAQREAMGWSVEQVADQLKLAVRQVVALEAGDYASLPGPAVVRGFVRAYAKVVKLEAAPLVAMIALDTPAPSDATATTVRRDKPTSFSEVRFPTNGKRAKALPVGLIIGAIALAGAAAAAWQFGVIPASLLGAGAPAASAPAAANGQASITTLPAPVVATTPSEMAPAQPASEPKPVISNAVPLISVPPPPSAVTTLPGAASPQGVAPAAAPPLATPASPAPSGNALVLTVREDSWIEVRPAKGKALFSRLVKGGTVETVTVDQPVTLIVGRPSAVDASLRGAPLVLPAIAGGKISRVNIK